MESESKDLPARIADALISIPKGLTPGVIKALDRLVGAAFDIPTAWLAQKKSKIDAQTESYRVVEASIAQAAALGAGSDPETAQRAMNVLIRKEYRKQINREAVASAMVEEICEKSTELEGGSNPIIIKDLDDDWLNIFEKYAEDASSERLQGLWGRVLAGEIRRPGRFSTRTLRFLSEFSQADALTFETFAKCAFGDAAPKSLAIPSEQKDIRNLIYLESNGLIQGSSGLGLQRNIKFNEDGFAFIGELDLFIVFKGEPNSKITHEAIALTPLGQELLCLVPSRNPRDAARSVALAVREDKIHEAYLMIRAEENGRLEKMEVFWIKEDPNAPTIDGKID